MSFGKRVFDIALALSLGLLLSPVIVILALLVLIRDGRPVFFLSERMKTPERGFRLVKFRTMTVSGSDSGVSGGDKVNRITRSGRFLRRSRLDELPQLWNILKGDMSFVGPRPPLRLYVERYPELYGEVLRNKPGVTGLATLIFHAHEARLLTPCKTPEATDAVYSRRCVPRKARLDLLYQKNSNLCFDAKILYLTLRKTLR
ncbi:sugar transferase [Celeribacter persicus]|uniref:Lipopolysaccharide/colanic/teichoic acid biosynthesis glycosyltransferase n=1 Tax=Celeribacter persicus TaxID=1651082 RepID=A0A2T5HTF7_9RHOB|nr:sugar transferase [Celeribacter persicus]PTQ74877.1 lipopolysaccharide/colanic/teichoic acid biosynthesis glycosyltransferase [Celeribacter persicus]